MARSTTFVIDGVIDTQVRITELADGRLRFDVEVLGTGSIGDLRGLFFDMTTDVDAQALFIEQGSIADDDWNFSGNQAVQEASVDRVIQDVNLKGEVTNELGDFDVGLVFGTAGINDDDIQKTSFILADGTGDLTLDMISLQEFGARYTSVGRWDGSDGRTGSAKIGGLANGVAQNDAVATDENTAADAVNVLANDTEGATSTILSFEIGGTSYAAGDAAPLVVDGKSLGTISVATDGAVTLEATGSDVDAMNAGEMACLGIVYTAQRGDGALATADMEVTITGVNDVPTLQTTNLLAAEDGPTVLADLTAIGDDADFEDDGATLAYAVVSQPSAGLASVDASGNLVFDPGSDFQELPKDATRDVFIDVQATDSRGASITQTMTVTVAGRNDAPVIGASSVLAGTVDEDGEDAPTVASGQMAASDIDDGATLNWSVLGGGLGAYGHLTIDAEGAWTYTLFTESPLVQSLTQADTLTETFAVQMIDEHGALDTRTVTITVTGSDDGPKIDNTFEGNENPDFFYGYEGNTAVDGLGGTDFLVGDYYNLQNSYWANTGFGYEHHWFIDNHETRSDGVGDYYDLEPVSTYYPDFGNDVINAGSGFDTVSGDAHYLHLNASWGDFTIAAGDDTLDGSLDGDTMYGEGYSQQVYSSSGYAGKIIAGADLIDGNSGADHLHGDGGYFYAFASGAASSTAEAIGGADVISGGDDNDWIYGEGYYLSAYSNDYNTTGTSSAVVGGGDTISGDGGYDVIYGDGQYLRAFSYNSANSGVSSNRVIGGADDISGGVGTDTIFGDGQFTEAIPYYGNSRDGLHHIDGGNDVISGGAEGDTIYGDFYRAYANSTDKEGEYIVTGGDDVISGDGGNDAIYGDFYVGEAHGSSAGAVSQVIAGNDTINGGAGNDNLWGDARQTSISGIGSYVTGADVFEFGPGSGLDTVHDFELGQDLIDVSGYGFTDFASLSSRITDDGTTTTIDFDGTASDIDEVRILIVVGLDADDFLFAVA